MKKLRRKIYNYSKDIGDRFGFDLPYFIENGFWVVFAQLVNMAASLAMSVVFARYLSKEVFGEYQLLISFLGLFAIVSYSGLNTSIMRSVAKGYDFSYVKAVNFSFKKSLIAIPLFLGLSVWYYFKAEEDLAIVFIGAGLLFSFIYAHNKWLAFSKGKGDFEKVAKRQILQNVILNILLIVSAILFVDNLFVVAGVYLFVNAGFNTFWHFKTKKSITNTKFDDDCIPYGKYMTKMGLLGIVLNNFDKILIGFLDIKLLAVYAIALKILNIVKGLIKSISSISFPKFAKKEITITNRTIFFLLIIGVVFSFFMYVFAEPLLNFLYTDKYQNSAILFKKFVFIIPLFFTNALFSNKILAQQYKKRIFSLRIIAPLISIVFSVIIFVLFKNTECFIISKIYSINILNFIILMPWFFKD